MTGCRVARGGMQERAGLRPDITCLGKIVGGGMPLAAYGGKRAIMEKVAPLGPVYQAGTLSGNPVAVSAGLAMLERLDDALYARLEALGRAARSGARARDRRARSEGLRAARRVDDHALLHAGTGAVVGRREGVRHQGSSLAGTADCSSAASTGPRRSSRRRSSARPTREADIDATVKAAKEALVP